MNRGQRWRHGIDVVIVLVARDFRGRYRNTGIGVLWSVLNPLLFLLTFYLVFARLMHIGIAHYASFAFTAIIAWSWLQGALQQSAESITSSATLTAQPGFPLQALPLAAVGSGLIHLLIALPLLALLLLAEGVPLTWRAVTVLPLLGLQGLLLLGMSFIVAALNVRYRDTQHILPVILQVGYFLTPIFYDLNVVGPEYRGYFTFNPMAVLIQAYRAVLMQGSFPDWRPLAGLFVLALLLLVVGRRYFERARDTFLEAL